ncbi:phospholipase A2 inhibitor NAI-like [Ascaphus truei]|uniref:phospholipase A2 inhibitor NAI-like n=1 Tax=Ascaphus truei TaxID=8439 RepID=UPI003F5AD360
MSSLLTFTWVISALIATGYSLSCKVCLSTDHTSCTGDSTICSAGKVCMSSYTVTTAPDHEVNTIFVRSCELQRECGMSGSINIPDGKIKMGTTCCTSDNCTPPIPTLPADNDVMNGVTCRTCASADSNWCYTSDTMECTGNEKMCLLQTTEMSGSISHISALRGCATKSVCDIGDQHVSGDGITIKLTHTCSSGSVGLHPGFFLPAVVALMLIKLLS